MCNDRSFTGEGFKGSTLYKVISVLEIKATLKWRLSRSMAGHLESVSRLQQKREFFFATDIQNQPRVDLKRVAETSIFKQTTLDS